VTVTVTARNGSHVRRGVTVPLVIAALVAACERKPASDDSAAYEHVMSFDTARVRLVGQRDTIPLLLELAIRPEQKTLGLMERRQMAENAGMLFAYDTTQPPDAGFWMYRTRIPLDIAFLDSTGVVRAVRAMVPCPTTIAQGCPSYTPDVPYRYAVEMNAGFFGRHGVSLGSTLVLSDLPPLSQPAPTAPK
jgi:uncharacterized protein